MAREIQIESVIAGTPSSPGKFVIGITPDNMSGNWTSVFHGKYYRDTMGSVVQFYTSPLAAPAGYELVVATTFFVKDNPTYNGKYTVYTQLNSGDHSPSSFASSQTTINVVEPVLTASTPSHMAGTGKIYNVSTYYLIVSGESPIVVPPGVTIEGRPLELIGRNFSGWGEVLQQNMLKSTQQYAGTTAPALPYLGQLWYDTSAGVVKIHNGTLWEIINASYISSLGKYTHTQASASNTWTFNHGLNASNGFVHSTFIVDTGSGVYKPILPQDVTYLSPNELSVSFSTAYAGYALISL